MIKQAVIEEASSAAYLALQLWPENNLETFEADMKNYILSEDAVIFLAYEGQDAIGFAQCQLRTDYVEGTDSSPVGYLEGLYVLDTYRFKGIAKLLVAHCEQWAKQLGCTQFASDCELDNTVSIKMHGKLGFVEANRIVCFVKSI